MYESAWKKTDVSASWLKDWKSIRNYETRKYLFKEVRI